MANRVYLFNTERPVTNPYRIHDAGPETGRVVEIADWARSIPVPWLLAFRREDAHAFTHVWRPEPDEAPEEPQTFHGYALGAPLEKVLANLRASKVLFAKVVNEPRLAAAYLDDAIRAFSALELPHVFLHAEELVDGDHGRLLAALDGTDAAVKELREWAAYTPEPRPWPLAERVPNERDEAGLWCGFGPEFEPDPPDEDEDQGESERDARVLLPRAEAGDAKAAAGLAKRYSMDGQHALAMEWLERAASGGDADAAFLLGYLHQGTWEGVVDIRKLQYLGPGEHPADYGKSFKWLRTAMDAGFEEPQAPLMLGEMCFKGVGTRADPAMAVKWFRRAAEQGDEKAQLWMAICSYYGLGTKRDYEAAANWTRLAADQGSPVSQYAMGLLYSEGKGVAKDAAEARDLMEQAASGGYEPANEFLAVPAWKLWGRPEFFRSL